MTTLTSKVCIVGDFAVGKTSICERFVNNHFSEKYLTTVGVKIDTKEVHLAGPNVDLKLVLWDVAGSDTFGDKEFAYLRGAAGFLFVADGTRSLTIDAVQRLRKEIGERYSDLPGVLMINKSDLAGNWEVKDSQIEKLREEFVEVYRTSAKIGIEVDEALTRLAELVVDRILSN